LQNWYAAGALLTPYKQFAATALELRHDVEQMPRLYHASFEQIGHPLSTLQRRGARGIPFYFVREDRAGNITQRRSSTPLDRNTQVSQNERRNVSYQF
jgi:predicted transcriptional regulator